MHRLLLPFVLLVSSLIVYFHLWGQNKIRSDANHLAQHFAAQTSVASYRITSTTSGQSVPTVTEVQLKNDRFYFKSEDVVFIDNTLYEASSSGVWQVSVPPPDKAAVYLRFHPLQIRQNYLDFQTRSKFKSQGQEKCGQLTCYKFQAWTPLGKTAARTFWFDTKDFLLQKDIFTYGQFTATNLYSYSGIDISPPGSR